MKCGLSRRRFLDRLSALSGGAAAAWLSFEAVRCAPPGARRAICRADALAVGGFKLFEYPGPAEPCILIRSAPDDFVAYARTCTHESCAVSYRPGADRLECPCHGGAYAVADGRVLYGPPPRGLERLRLEREDGYIVVTGLAA
jgi:Rieske Fe-S protein